jgi:hypothetical protein
MVVVVVVAGTVGTVVDEPVVVGGDVEDEAADPWGDEHPVSASAAPRRAADRESNRAGVTPAPLKR